MVGRRELNKQRTRETLLTVALDLFEERGFDQVTIDEIADAAEVAPRTFYRYFPTKEALLYDDTGAQLEVVRRSIIDAPENASPMEALQEAIAGLARHTVDARAHHYRVARVATDAPSLGVYQRTVLQPLTEQTIVDAFAERMGVDTEVDQRPLVLALVGVALMSAIGQAWVRSGGVVDVDALITEHIHMLKELIL